jgi:hypothetical protein
MRTFANDRSTLGRNVLFICPLILFFVHASPSSAQQGQPALQITSPANGSILNPGQTLSVTVASPAGLTLTNVMVMGELQLGLVGSGTSVPATVSTTIPATISPGQYMLTAMGLTSAGQVVQSATILIGVERPDSPVSLLADPVRILPQSQGQRQPLRISATFSDGAILDVTGSTNMAYSSSNTSVATVNANGTVTAVGTGAAIITAAYGQGTSSLLATVSVSVPPPVLSPSPSSLSFGNQAVGTGSSSQPLSVTNVGKNQGLKITGVGTTGNFSETDNCVSSTPLAVGASCTINVTFAPTAEGPRTGAINISNSQAIIPLAVPLAGTGVCHYVSITPSPSSVAVGGTVTITGSVMSCTNSTQTIVVQFILTGPLQSGSCSSTNSVMYTPPPFALPASTKKTMSFPFTVPKNACPGSYTIIATTSVSGIAVDTSSATLTVRAY